MKRNLIVLSALIALLTLVSAVSAQSPACTVDVLPDGTSIEHCEKVAGNSGVSHEQWEITYFNGVEQETVRNTNTIRDGELQVSNSRYLGEQGSNGGIHVNAQPGNGGRNRVDN